ncbi:MAG: M20/M25/M40 family metallo-hydrolase [Haloarculaceae archaeon]
MDSRELTRDLVSIPSHDDETAAGDRIEGWLRTHTDAAVDRDTHGNVIARREPVDATAAAPSLALVGHHDVVAPDDSQLDSGEYVVEDRDGRLYGRGTADMKGAVAAAMIAFRDATDLECELVFVSFVGEEQGGVGARAAIEGGFAPDYAVVGEGSTDYSTPGVTDVVIAHKGRRGSTIVATGNTAHASVPETGENAIYRASDAVDVVREMEFPATEVLGHDLEGSIAVTEIEGGSAWNVIPEHCAVTIDERTVPGERAPLERVEEIDGVSWTIDQDLPPMRCDDADFAALALAVAEETQAGSPEHVVKPHASDAGWLAGAGTTCVVCGPAESGEAHTADESVSWEVVERCERIYRAVAERFPGGSGDESRDYQLS